MTIAWGFVICGIGISAIGTYEFSSTAVNMTIGLGCGMAFGILTGLFAHKLILQNREYHADEMAYHSLWSLINVGLWKIESEFMRFLVTSVAVTVIMGIAMPLPLPMGACCGIVMGNHLAIQMGHWKRPQPGAPSVPSTPVRRSHDGSRRQDHAQAAEFPPNFKSGGPFLEIYKAYGQLSVAQPGASSRQNHKNDHRSHHLPNVVEPTVGPPPRPTVPPFSLEGSKMGFRPRSSSFSSPTRREAIKRLKESLP